MKQFEDLIKSMAVAQKLNDQQKLYRAAVGIANQQDLWKANSIGLKMYDGLFKATTMSDKFYKASITKDMFAKAFDLPRINVPKSAFDAIGLISQHHTNLSKGIGFDLAKFATKNDMFGRMTSLNFALEGASKKLATYAAVNNNWGVLNNYEKFSAKAVTINDNISESEGITLELLTELKETIAEVKATVNKIDKDASLLIWKIIIIISFILQIASEIRDWLPKPNYATKEQVEQVIKDNFQELESKLNPKTESRTTIRICKVHLKPKSKTIILVTLPIHYKVIKLQENHKWMYISYNDPKDNTPQTGWVLKKYLN